MDAVTKYGNIKENIDSESFARRTYEKKWGFLSARDVNKLYNQNNLQQELRESDYKEQCPYQYTREGDSYFVSKDMYNMFLAKCRCDRPKSHLHIIKCLQKLQNDCLDISLSQLFNNSKVDRENGRDTKSYPRTTAGEIGWMPHRYKEWEWSTHYASPKYDMPGYKIDSHPYSNIFIG